MSNTTTINLQEKRDFGQVINATFSFIRLTYKKMFKDLLLMAGPFALLSGILSAIYQLNGLSNVSQMEVFTSLFSFEYILSMISYAVGFTVATAIVGNYVFQYKISGGAEINSQAVIKNVKAEFFKIFTTNIIYVLLIFGGFILLVIPGIYFGLALSLAVIIRILNKDKGMGDAFSESRRLISGNWWRTFGLFFIISIIAYVFSLIFLIPEAITSFLITFNSRAGSGIEQYRLIHIILMGIGGLSSIIIVSISTVAMAIYYFSLKEEKDEVSLMEKIETLGSQEMLKRANEGSY